MKILMSRDNVTGRKLEYVLQDLIDDIKEKTSMIENSDKKEKDVIIDGNNDIINHLEKSIIIQNDLMAYLATQLGADKGPSQPRI
jgi:hypothetical protein